MSEFKIVFEWESAGGARGPELRATWARLEILIDGEPVTRLEDLVAHSIRNAIYGPLYSVAEWIATNWWSLLYEIPSPMRMRNGYSRRHDLADAAEGFALPRLTFQPEGKHVLARWEPQQFKDRRVRFLSNGVARLERRQLEAELSEFVEAVVRRLHDQSVPNTLLAEEWEAIQNANPEERMFNQAAGLLGKDPYALSDEESREIIAAVESLPSGLVEEFLATVDHEQLLPQSRAVAQFLKKARTSQFDVAMLRGLRDPSRSFPIGLLPWEEGYEFARQLRLNLGADGRRIRSMSDLADLFRVEIGQWEQAISSRSNSLEFIDAAVAETRMGSPYFFVSRPRPEARLFALCRALFEYLTAPDGSGALVTSAYSERQKRNRAFSAEFIAPADLLRQSITGSVVGDEDIQELAAEFGTSEFVIRHQIDNHRIAKMAGVSCVDTLSSER